MKQRDASHGFLGVSTEEQSDARPADGDVVMVEEKQTAATLYSISTRPAPPQARYRSYAEALNSAQRYAQQHHVDCWFTRDDIAFVRLTRHREPAG